jgi:hypothetical protein
MTTDAAKDNDTVNDDAMDAAAEPAPSPPTADLPPATLAVAYNPAAGE